MDVRAVKAAGDKAVKWCRDGNGPIILEMLTYRYRGHSMSDPAKYRPKEEVDKMRTEHDPIEQVRSRLLKKGFASEDALEEDRRRGARHRQRGGRVRHQRCRARSVRALDRRVRRVGRRWLSSHPSWLYLALAGALASWIAGAWFYARTLRATCRRARAARLAWRAVVPSSPGRLRSAGSRARPPRTPANVNKALVAFLACSDGRRGGDVGGDQSRAGLPLGRQRVMRPCRSKS